MNILKLSREQRTTECILTWRVTPGPGPVAISRPWGRRPASVRTGRPPAGII